MKALVLAGGIPQIELLRQLRERGVETVLIDGSPLALAIPYADKFYHENIFDINEVKNIAVNESVNFIITVCADQVLVVAAQVSEMLGLPFYIDYQTAQNVSDKIKMKRIFVKNGIPTTKYAELKRLDYEAVKQLNYPLIVKPVDAYSSKGVRKAENEDQLSQYYAEAEKISRNNGVIVEEFFSGEELSVDAFVVNGKVHILAITNSDKLKDKNRFVIFRGRYPAEISTHIKKLIEETAQNIASSFDLVNSPLLIQLLHNGKEISVLEFCARTGGNMKWLLIKYSCGVDVISATTDIILGKKPDITVKDTGNKIVVNDFIYCNPGIFDHFEGFDEMIDKGLINEFHPVRVKGTEIHGTNSSSDRIAGMNIIADSVEEFNKKQRIIINSVKVIDKDGRDIMRRDLLPDLKS